MDFTAKSAQRLTHCGRPAQELRSFGKGSLLRLASKAKTPLRSSRLGLIVFRTMQTVSHILIAGEGLVGALRHDEGIERELGTEQWSGAENSDGLHAERIS